VRGFRGTLACDDHRTTSEKAPSGPSSCAFAGGICESNAAPAETEAAANANPLVGEFISSTGDTINLADFQGENVVLWFWEPW